ncbi:DUF2971 domain-containing protein [Aeromonas veronii]
MPILYKYYDSYFKGLVIAPKLKLTPPLHLNDPFERKIPHGLERMVLNFFKPQGLSDIEIKEKTIKICEIELNKLGITAMTETHDNILMWSHYANSHKGVCIGYDTDKICDENMQLLPVKYLENRFEESDIVRCSNLAETFDKVEYKVVTTKSPQWQYEKEYRYVTSLTYANEISIKAEKKTDTIIDDILKHHNGYNYHFNKENVICNEHSKTIKINSIIGPSLLEELVQYSNISFFKKIDQNSITSIYIGCNSEINVCDVQRDLDDAGLKNITVKKYMVSDDKFELEIQN